MPSMAIRVALVSSSANLVVENEPKMATMELAAMITKIETATITSMID